MRPLYSVISTVTAVSLMLMASTLSSTTSANAFEFQPVTFLQKANKPLPFEGPIPLAGGLATIETDVLETVQVPGCVDGDTSSYPVQKARFYNINKKDFTPGGPVQRIIIISQTDPLPEGTNLQLFTIDQCTSGDQLYYKIEASTTP